MMIQPEIILTVGGLLGFWLARFCRPMTNFEMVQQFHESLGQPMREYPGFPHKKMRMLRRQLIAEELPEYSDADDADDLVAVADALADLQYFIYGSAVVHGLPMDKIFAEVHRSNMTKFKHGPTFREDGKLLKGDGFEPPRIKEILDEHH